MLSNMAVHGNSCTTAIGSFAVLLATLAVGVAAANPPDNDLVYVSNETGGDIAVIDPTAGTVIERIAVGKRPRGVKLSHDGTQLFVALSGSPIGGPGVDESKLPPPDRAADGIGVVDVATRKLIRTYRSGQDPEAFDLSPDGRTLYVSNEETAEMSVLDLASGNVVARVPIGAEPEGVTVRPDGRYVYVTCEADNSIVAVDTKTLDVAARIATGARPRAMLFTADGSTAYASAELGHSVAVLDAGSQRVVATIPLAEAGAPTAPLPMGLAFAPDGRRLYVTTGRRKSVIVINVGTRAVEQEFYDIGARPWSVAVSRDGRTIYTANGPSDDVSMIDAATGKVERRINVGGRPWGLVLAGR
jgi:YVTN family beta-propeller protein